MLSWLKGLMFAKNTPVIIEHQLLEDFKLAIENNDNDLVKNLLKRFSLLRLNKFNPDDHKYDDFIDTIAKARTPQIIYEILAAGFPVVDLLRGLQDYGKDQSYLNIYFVKALLPRFSQQEFDCLSAGINPEVTAFVKGINKCILTHEIPKLPIIFDRMNYDLEPIIDGIKTSGDLLNIGYKNEPIINNIDEMILDLKYLANAQDFLKNNNIINLAANNNENPFTNKDFTDQIEFIIYQLRGIKHVPWNTSGVTIYSLFAITFSAGGIVGMKILGHLLENLLKGDKNDAVFAKSYPDLFCFNNAALDEHTICKYALCSIFTLMAIHIYRRWPDEKDKLTERNWNNDFTKFAEFGRNVSNTTEIINIDDVINLRISLEHAKFFDFEKARAELPKRIAQRFYAEYQQNISPPLMFWKQAFEQEVANNPTLQETATQIKPENTPALRLI